MKVGRGVGRAVVGWGVGNRVGLAVVGLGVGLILGFSDGTSEGEEDGSGVGFLVVGAGVGDLVVGAGVGLADGLDEGAEEGMLVGFLVGALVNLPRFSETRNSVLAIVGCSVGASDDQVGPAEGTELGVAVVGAKVG